MAAVAALDVVPEDVVHPGLLGGWLVSKPPVPRRTPDEVHANARLSVKGHELLVERIETAGWSLTEAAITSRARVGSGGGFRIRAGAGLPRVSVAPVKCERCATPYV